MTNERLEAIRQLDENDSPDVLAMAVAELLDQVTVAAGAIEYVLRRVGADTEFAYHMTFTESFERLVRAYATLTCGDGERIRRDILSLTRTLPQSSCAANREFIADGGRI